MRPALLLVIDNLENEKKSRIPFRITKENSRIKTSVELEATKPFICDT